LIPGRKEVEVLKRNQSLITAFQRPATLKMKHVYLALVRPIAYLVVLVSFISLFSIYYRCPKAFQSQPLDPWFTNNDQRDVYLTLIHLENPCCPASLLKAALFNRALEDI
jgi:translocation protein SEC66